MSETEESTNNALKRFLDESGDEEVNFSPKRACTETEVLSVEENNNFEINQYEPQESSTSTDDNFQANILNITENENSYLPTPVPTTDLTLEHQIPNEPLYNNNHEQQYQLYASSEQYQLNPHLPLTQLAQPYTMYMQGNAQAVPYFLHPYWNYYATRNSTCYTAIERVIYRYSGQGYSQEYHILYSRTDLPANYYFHAENSSTTQNPQEY